MADDRGCSLGAVGLAFVTGGLVGAAVALLLAPQSGRESREQLRGYRRRAEENIHELADKAIEAMDQMLDQGLDQAVDKGHEFLKDTQAILTEAVEAVTQPIQRERKRLSGEKKA